MNKVKLGELLKIKHGFAFKSENYVDESEYALVTLANISASNNFQFNRDKTTFYGAAFPKDFILQEDDLIMPLTEQVVGLFGNSAFVPKIEGITFVLNQRVGKVVPNEEKADKYYLHYLLATDIVKDQLEYRASGTRQRNISPTDVYDVEVFVPDLETQKRIGKCLYNIERKINSNSKINDNLEQQMRMLYDYWFTQYDFPNENGLPYKTSGGKMLWNDTLKREIPLNWCVAPMTNIFTFESGYPFSSDLYHLNGKYKLLTIKNVQNNGINLNVDSYINVLPSNMPDYCLLRSNDILMSLTGNVGRIGIMYAENCLLNQRVALAKPNKKEWNSFVYFLLKSDLVHKQYETLANGSSQQNLSPIEAGNVTIAFNENVVDKYSAICEKHLSTIVRNLAENQELSNLRDWLLPMLMNGQATIED